MAKFRIRNTSKTHLGFSFGNIFKNKYFIVDEVNINTNDWNLIRSSSVAVEDPDSPVPVVVPEVPKVVKEKLTLEPSNPKEIMKQNSLEPITPKDLKDTTTDSRKHSREDLNTMKRKDLVALAESLGVMGRSRIDIIEGIVKSQEKQNG